MPAPGELQIAGLRALAEQPEHRRADGGRRVAVLNRLGRVVEAVDPGRRLRGHVQRLPVVGVDLVEALGDLRQAVERDVVGVGLGLHGVDDHEGHEVERPLGAPAGAGRDRIGERRQLAADLAPFAPAEDPVEQQELAERLDLGPGVRVRIAAHRAFVERREVEHAVGDVPADDALGGVAREADAIGGDRRQDPVAPDGQELGGDAPVEGVERQPVGGRRLAQPFQRGGQFDGRRRLVDHADARADRRRDDLGELGARLVGRIGGLERGAVLLERGHGGGERQVGLSLGLHRVLAVGGVAHQLPAVAVFVVERVRRLDVEAHVRSVP